jgi:hypothetical protein
MADVIVSRQTLLCFVWGSPPSVVMAFLVLLNFPVDSYSANNSPFTKLFIASTDRSSVASLSLIQRSTLKIMYLISY